MAVTPVPVDGVVPYPVEFAEKYRSAGYWTGQTHADMFAATVARFPDKTAVISGDREITYAELGDRVRRLAAGFLDRGLERGDRVVVHLPNIPEYLEMVFALWEIGAVPVFALAAHKAHEISYFIEFSGARGYITDTLPEGKLPPLDFCWTVNDGSFAGLAAGEPLVHAQRSNPADIAFLQLSGGTTGLPKMIPRTHDDYLYSVRASNEICDITEHTVQLVVLPISHNFTMSSPGVLGAVMAGATMVLAPDGMPETAFPLIEKHRVTQSQLVPPLALLWLNSPLKDGYDLSSLETLQVGGAKFSEEAARRVGPELGVTLQQVFGMAEGLVNYTRLDDAPATIAATQGLRMSPDDEVRVVDAADNDVPAGTPGDLLTRGPYTIRGYFRASEVNRRSFTEDGFYRTGDVVRMDERGYLTVLGRSKDQINRGGEKISPEEVENLLLGHEGIHDVSVVGVPDDDLGERTRAYIIPREGVDPAGLGVLAVKRFLRDRGLAAFKIPDMIEFVDEFPQTAVGKVSKRDQREE